MFYIINIINKTIKFKIEANAILGQLDNSKSRIYNFKSTEKRLKLLSLNQEELFLQAIKCIENGLYKASYVMAWASFMDYLQNSMVNHNLPLLIKKYPKWKITDSDSLRNIAPEFQIIEAAEKISLLTNSEKKSVLGLLSKRNECAHPNPFCPDMNQSLGYITELIHRVELINKKI